MSKTYRPARTQRERDDACVVMEPSKPTEFEVQARIYMGLKALGINARGEVKTGRPQI